MTTTVYRPASISTGDVSITGNSTISGTETVGSNLTVDTNTLYVDATSNEVGIRTTSPDGTLHVHTASAGTITPSTSADDLIVESSGSTGISILSPDADYSALIFGSPADNVGAFFQWNYSGDTLQFGTSKSGGTIIIYADASTEVARMTSAGNLGIGGTPNANALLDVQSTTKAFMPPRMTTTQKNAIAGPASGMVVYDSTLGKLCVRGAAAWETVTSV